MLGKPTITYIVLDIIKPHKPNVAFFASSVKELKGIKKVNLVLLEINENTDNLKIIINGIINYEELRNHLYRNGAIIHSVDQVVVERL